MPFWACFKALAATQGPDAREIMSILFFAFSGLPFARRTISSESWYYSTSGVRAGLDLDLIHWLQVGQRKKSGSKAVKQILFAVVVVLKAVPNWLSAN